MTTLSRCLRLAALSAAGAALLWSAPATAQRRVITAPGAKPVESRAEPKPEEKKEAAPASEATPAATPAPTPAAPAAAKKEEPPPAPTLLVPADEAAAPSARPVAAAAPKLDEVLYRKKLDKTLVTMRVRPAHPVPGRSTTVHFEIVRILSVPDPSLGDRLPLEKATLVATVSRDGAPATRHRLHPLPEAGVYGMHFTVADAAVYRLGLEQRIAEPEIGETPLATDFLLGIGQETPVKADDDESASVRTGRRRTALRVDEGSSEGIAVLMRALGEAWMRLWSSMESPGGAGDRVAAAQAIAGLTAKLPGLAPQARRQEQPDFDALAGDLHAALKDLPAAVEAFPEEAGALIARTETQSCARCHVKFRFQLTDDVSAWPSFTPRAPQETTPGPRRPVR